MTPGRVPVTGEALPALIARLNDDHLEQLLYCVRAFTPAPHAQDARMVTLFANGADVEVRQGEHTARHFLPFSSPGDPQQAFEATALDAMKHLGVWPPRRVNDWQLRGNRLLTPHFRRLTFSLNGDTRRDWRPGDSCRFDLAPGVQRPYTLRRVQGDVAEVDVYCHGGTPGSRWAQALHAGQTVTVRGERHEIFPEFTAGPTLLLGDETALPALAAVLEGWTSPFPVLALLEVADPADHAYLQDVPLPAGAQVQWLARRGPAGAALQEAARALDWAPGAVWGAAEVGAAQALRHALKRQHPGADVKVIGYWRAS